MTKEDMVRAFNMAADPSRQSCQVHVQEDSPSHARLLLKCPAIRLPAIAGLPAGLTLPPSSIPMTIAKTEGIDQWTVDSQMPGAFGIVPAANWRSEFNRIGDIEKCSN